MSPWIDGQFAKAGTEATRDTPIASASNATSKSAEAAGVEPFAPLGLPHRAVHGFDGSLVHALIERVDAFLERADRLGELLDNGDIAGIENVALRLSELEQLIRDGRALLIRHENSLAGYGANPNIAPMASGEGATSPDGDTVRDATYTPSPRLAGRAGDVRGGGATSPGRGSAG